jgi:DNA-binding CsgD family transcriptional regulator
MSTDLPDAAEIQALYRLILELCEKGTSTQLWREHFQIEMEKRVGAPMSVSYLMRFSLDPNDIGPRTLIYMERGMNESWKRYLANGDLSGDPVTPHIMRRFGTNFTVRRAEFVDDAAWLASDYYKNVAAPADFGDIIYSQVAVNDPKVVDGLSFARRRSDPQFTQKDVATVRLVHTELARLWNREDPIGQHILPARQREVLDAIRRGESRKTIADKMAVSEHTVHSYEKALFERAGVSSRGELLASISGVIRPNLLP